MASSTLSVVREVLRESGPLGIDELTKRVLERRPLASKHPNTTVANAMRGDLLCQRTGDKRYVYLPTYVRGASVRVPMDEGFCAPKMGRLAIGADVSALLCLSVMIGETERHPTIALEHGPTVAAKPEHDWWPGRMLEIVDLPAGFWRWREAQQQTGADALLLRCEDGEAGRFTARAIRTAALDAAAVAARNAQLQTAAVAVAAAKQTHGLSALDLALGLHARGVYHGEPPPDPLDVLLRDPAVPLIVEYDRVTYRPDLTPALRRLFADRLKGGQPNAEMLILGRLGLTPLAGPDMPALDLEESAEETGEEEESADDMAPIPPATQGFRLKVTLQRSGGVWRTIEMLDNQTLADLHYAIQDAFGWDDDHLHSFYLSGRAFDRLTEVAGTNPYTDEYDPPMDDEVTLADLELKPRQRFLYLFDFGDQLSHDVEVIGAFPVPATGEFPRLAEIHGVAPPQYPDWDEDDGEENEAEEEDDRNS